MLEALDGFAEVVEELVRELIRNIKTEACCALFEPVVEDAVLAADEVGILLVVLVDVGESVDAPPCLIDIG